MPSIINRSFSVCKIVSSSTLFYFNIFSNISFIMTQTNSYHFIRFIFILSFWRTKYLGI